MWIVNEDGFFSVTSGNPDDYRKLNVDDSYVVVRGRDHASMVSMQWKLGRDVPIVGPWPEADYRYRMAVTKERFAKYLSEYVMDDLTYVSFKGAMANRWWYYPKRIQHARQVALIDIWAAAQSSWAAPGYEDYPSAELVTESQSG